MKFSDFVLQKVVFLLITDEAKCTSRTIYAA
jgi:hypothetical protein